MNFNSCLAAVALCCATTAVSAGPTCDSKVGLGGLGPPGLALFGNSFKSAGSYSDCYTFSLKGQTNSFGGVISLDPWLNKLDIVVNSVSLYHADTWLGTDTSPFGFSFGSLAGSASTYTLQVLSTVSKDLGLYASAVGYAGKIATLAAPVPEPTAYALAMAGLVAVGAGVWRRRQR